MSVINSVYKYMCNTVYLCISVRILEVCRKDENPEKNVDISTTGRSQQTSLLPGTLNPLKSTPTAHRTRTQIRSPRNRCQRRTGLFVENIGQVLCSYFLITPFIDKLYNKVCEFLN